MDFSDVERAARWGSAYGGEENARMKLLAARPRGQQLFISRSMARSDRPAAASSRAGGSAQRRDTQAGACRRAPWRSWRLWRSPLSRSAGDAQENHRRSWRHGTAAHARAHLSPAPPAARREGRAFFSRIEAGAALAARKKKNGEGRRRRRRRALKLAGWQREMQNFMARRGGDGICAADSYRHRLIIDGSKARRFAAPAYRQQARIGGAPSSREKRKKQGNQARSRARSRW